MWRLRQRYPKSRPATDPSSQRHAAGRRISGRRYSAVQPMGPNATLRGARCHLCSRPSRRRLGGLRSDRYFYRKRNPAAIGRELAADIGITAEPQSAGLRWHQHDRRVASERCREVAFKGFPAHGDVSSFAGPLDCAGTPLCCPGCPQPCRPKALPPTPKPLADLKVLREAVFDDRLRFYDVGCRLTMTTIAERMELMSPIDALFLSAESRRASAVSARCNYSEPPAGAGRGLCGNLSRRCFQCREVSTAISQACHGALTSTSAGRPTRRLTSATTRGGLPWRRASA